VKNNFTTTVKDLVLYARNHKDFLSAEGRSLIAGSYLSINAAARNKRVYKALRLSLIRNRRQEEEWEKFRQTILPALVNAVVWDAEHGVEETPHQKNSVVGGQLSLKIDLEP